MRVYLDLLRHVLDRGLTKGDRTGTGTRSVFGHQMRFDLREGFPLLTTKRVWFRALARELLWFLSGSTNVKPLVDHGILIWTDWLLKRYLEREGLPVPRPNTEEWAVQRGKFADRIRSDDAFARTHGDLGPVYGRQWRDFRGIDQIAHGIDQIARVIDSLRTRPESRRHVVCAWNPAQNERMALPPCHLLFQFHVGDGRLSCQLYIRSNDLFLGAPFNIAQYALLTHMVAQQTDLEVGDLVYTIGDAHAYLNHIDQIEEQLRREPFPLPEIRLLRRPPSIFAYEYEDFEIVNYRHHPAIRAPIAV